MSTQIDFVAIDVETANSDMASICQIGMARFVDGDIVEEWSTLIDPEGHFDGMNVSIHGIEPHMVRGKPKLPSVVSELRAYLEGNTSVCHTHFDRVSIGQAFDKYKIEMLRTFWLDSARVARRTWPEVAWKGYGLKKLCKRIGYKYRPHDALEDAKAAGHVLLAAMEHSKLDLEAWKRRVNQPIDPSCAAAGISRDGNPEGDLYGEVVVFTGSLKLPRRQAADFAASAGCRVGSNVTKDTTILVVGDEDTSRLAGYDKSRKHRKAEELASKGHPIRVIFESDFDALLRASRDSLA